MAQKPREIVPFDIDRLYDFLDGLKVSGFDVDARHYIALSDLLLSLAARGEKLNEISLKMLIAPIVCSSPSEQETFYSRFEQWYPTMAPELEGAVSHETISSSGQAKESTPAFDIRLLLARFVPVIATIAGVIGALITLISAFAQINFQNSELVIRYAFWFLFVGLAGWIGWFMWNQYQENQFITRESAREEPVYTSIQVAAHFHDALPAIEFKPVVSALRRRTSTPSHEVDVEQTIERALETNRWLEFVYQQRKVMPEYVVLIDRKSQLDQQARFVQEVLNRLSADGVWLHQYEFSGDPRLCFPLDKKDTLLHLKDLQARYPEARLLVFSGANEFINPLTGQLQNWIEPLSHWRERAIITPDKLKRALREELQTRDFAVLPMSLTGLASLVRAFEADNSYLERGAGAQLPPPLTDRPTRWTGRDAPPDDEVISLLADVKSYLGGSNFFWLCATAIYPEMRWELTLHLGNELKGAEGNPILSSAGLVKLIHLPWFRYGYMPDWIRTTLIEQLSPEQEKQVRDVLENLLASTYVGEGFDLVFSRSRNESLGKRTRRFIDALIRNAPPDSQLKDYIFIKFISSNRLRRLAVQIPRIWNDIKGINPIWIFGAGIAEFVRNQNQRLRQSRSRPIISNRGRTKEEPKQANSQQRNDSVQIFISYSRKDVEFVRKLAGDLEKVGFNVWWDISNLRGGDDLARVIPEAIAAREYFIVILTPDSVASDWVQKEYAQALTLRKKILPILLKQTKVPLALSTIQYVDFSSGEYRDNLNNLLSPLGYFDESPNDKSSEQPAAQIEEKISSAKMKYQEALRDNIRNYFDQRLIPQVARDSYSDQMAWLLAKMSHLAYDRFEDDGESRELLMTKLKSGGFKLIATFNSPETDTQAFLASNNEFAVLAFRGTEPSKRRDIVADTYSAKISTIQGRVQRGFYEAFASIEASILREVKRLKEIPIFITGHSLGAALATVAAQRLEQERAIRNQIAACYTFGSPRVGNAEFDKEFRSPIYRVVNTTDIVTVIPLLAFGYVHVGDVRYLGRQEGNIQRGIPFFQRLFFFMTAFFGLFGPLLRDHAITEYVRKLEIIAIRNDFDFASEAPARSKK